MPGRSSLLFTAFAMPGIHILAAATKNVDGRECTGHDDR